MSKMSQVSSKLHGQFNYDVFAYLIGLFRLLQDTDNRYQEFSLVLGIVSFQNKLSARTDVNSNHSMADSIWQGLRIMWQLPDLLGEPKYSTKDPQKNSLLWCLFTFKTFLIISLPWKSFVVFGAAVSPLAITWNRHLSTTTSSHIGMPWWVDWQPWFWPWVGPYVSVASSDTVMIITISYFMDCCVPCSAAALCSPNSWVSLLLFIFNQCRKGMKIFKLGN